MTDDLAKAMVTQGGNALHEERLGSPVAGFCTSCEEEARVVFVHGLRALVARGPSEAMIEAIRDRMAIPRDDCLPSQTVRPSRYHVEAFFTAIIAQLLADL